MALCVIPGPRSGDEDLSQQALCGDERVFVTTSHGKGGEGKKREKKKKKKKQTKKERRKKKAREQVTCMTPPGTPLAFIFPPPLLSHIISSPARATFPCCLFYIHSLANQEA